MLPKQCCCHKLAPNGAYPFAHLTDETVRAPVFPRRRYVPIALTLNWHDAGPKNTT
jgi:hypothetical protein